MTEITYPGLYHEADDTSNAKQRMFLSLVRWEYAFLFFAAVFGLDLIRSPYYNIAYALVFIVPFALLLIRSFTKPEQSWYQSRALAESVKTSTWKYIMRAKPYEGEASITIPRANFRNHLRQIFFTNSHVGQQFVPDAAEMEQVTSEMDAIRALPLEERKAFYFRERVDSQRAWYAKKAAMNRRFAKYTVLGLCGLYVLAFLIVLSRIAFPDVTTLHAEPLVVLASALIGWMQIRKYNELSISYNLTAIEIGLIKAQIVDVNTDDEFSAFIDDAEQAFSREHTQWVARRSR